MKRFLILCLFLPMFAAQGRNSLAVILQDTTILNDTLHLNPYFGNTKARSLGNFAVLNQDKIAFQTYAGSSVLNTLRGHTPNFSVGPNTSVGTPGLRNGESLLVIDGLPLNSSISSYTNLNSFDYQSVYALSSGSATSLYGGQGANGAFFLQSKTGENFSKPSVEFNSSTTETWSEGTSITGESETIRQTIYTNAIAYQQDFGAVDTRISYTYSGLPDGSADAQTQSGYANLKINTGLTIASRFKARLIFDDFYTRSTSSQMVAFQGPAIRMSSESMRKNLQGNLQLQYQVLSWLKLSSQSSLSKIQNDNVNVYQTTTTTDREQKRYFANLYASFDKSLNSVLSVSAFAGYQYEKLKSEQYSEFYNGNSGSWSENKTTGFAAGAGIQIKNYLFSNFNYRMDYLSIYAEENNSVPTWSLNTSLVFSEALHWESPGFSFGKMRMSFGKTSVASSQGYPQSWSSYSPIGAYPNPYLHASAKQTFETGIDLGFLKNRLTLNATYFDDPHKDVEGVMVVPGTSGYYYVRANLWNVDTKGWELVLGGTTIEKNNFSMTSKLIWANYRTHLEYTNGESQGGGQVIANTTPDWTGSFLNQIEYKGFFTSFLIDVRRGGDFITTEYGSSFPVITVQDGTNTKLRDLSIGYRFSENVLDKLNIRGAQFSLSGRNIWTIYSKADDDVESSASTTAQKSLCLSLTLMF